MNNIEKITYIQNKIDIYRKNYIIDNVETDLLNEIADLLKELKEPQTLLEFLGWEEGAEYATEYIYDEYKYKVINNTLFFTRTGYDWRTYSMLNFSRMKQAKKVEPKKYHLRLKRKYVDFFDTFGGKNLLSLYDCKDFMISDVSCEDDKNQIEFTEEEINNIVLPEPLSLDMFDKVEVK